jgi:hypothetical protein
MVRRGQRGQAAVEGIGIAVIVAILLAAAASWLVREARPPDRPPDLVAAAAAPLTREPGPFDARYPLPPRFATTWRGSGADEPIGAFLRRVAGGARDGAILARDMDRAFVRGFGNRLEQRGREVLDDPFGALVGLSRDPDFLAPTGAFHRAMENARALRDYAEELHDMPLRQAALRASEDAGGLAADGTVEAVRIAVTRRIRGRAPRPPRPGPAPERAERR